MQCGVTSYMNLLADDAKLMRVVKNTDDCRELQGYINKIDEWSKRWKLDFNAKKCHVVELGKSKKKAKIELQDGTGGNTQDKGRKTPRGGDTRYTEPRAAHESTIWVNI